MIEDSTNDAVFKPALNAYCERNKNDRTVLFRPRHLCNCGPPRNEPNCNILTVEISIYVRHYNHTDQNKRVQRFIFQTVAHLKYSPEFINEKQTCSAM